MQFNPGGPDWGNMSWAHFVSGDLVRWQPAGVILVPTKPYDSAGVFTGSTTLVDGDPVVVYTCDASGNVQLQCVARPANRSDPTLRQWVKQANNPVIAAPPTGVPRDDFRDPTTAWLVDGRSRLAVAAFANGTGHVVQYSTTDFESFELDGILFSDPTPDSEFGMFECPDFFNITAGPNATWVIKASTTSLRSDWYALGWYDAAESRFVQMTPLRILNGGQLYSSKSFFDPVRARRVVWGWTSEESSSPAQAGWQGSQTLPSVMALHPTLSMATLFPIPELEQLRNQTLYVAETVQLPPNTSLAIAVDAGLMVEVRATFPLLKADDPGLLRSTWRRCVEARWAAVAGAPADAHAACAEHEAAAARSASAQPIIDEVGIALRAGADGHVATRVSVRSIASSGPLNNTDMPGGDYRFFALPASNPAEQNIANCSATCHGEPDCVGWVYVRVGGPGGAQPSGKSFPVPRCAMKSAVTPSDVNPWCVSGTVASLALVNDLSATGGSGSNPTAGQPLPVLPADQDVDIAVWMDHSVLESFAAGGLARIVSRVYPPTNASQLGIYNAGSSGIDASNIAVYTMDRVVDA